MKKQETNYRNSGDTVSEAFFSGDKGPKEKPYRATGKMSKITLHPRDKTGDQQEITLFANDDQGRLELSVKTWDKGHSGTLKLSPEEAIAIGRTFYKLAYLLGYKDDK